MANDQEEHAELIARLQRGGYVIGESRTDANGVVSMLIGAQWMTTAELKALSTQDSEVEEKL